MADKIMDAEDRLLKSMFEPEPIADDGFSRQVVGRIRRRIWVRRLALPIAIFIGSAIAFKPAAQLLVAASKLLTVMPQEVVNVPAGWLPRIEGAIAGEPVVPMLVYGIVLVGLGFAGSRKLVE